MKSLSSRTGLSNLPAELIHEISTYLSEEDKENAEIVLKVFSQNTTSVIHHVDAIITPSHKRKRYTTVELQRKEYAALYDAYRQKVSKLLRSPQYVSRLKSFTLLQPYDFKATDALRLSIRKNRDTTLVGNTVKTDNFLRLLSQNALHLRRFETTISNLSLIPRSVNLTELKIPSETSLHNISLLSLTRLTVVHRAMETVGPAFIPSLPKLLYLHIQVMGGINQIRPHLSFVSLNNFPALQEFMVSQRDLPETRWLAPLGYAPSNFVYGDSTSLRHVTLHKAWFRTSGCFTDWLYSTAPELLQSLSFNSLNFGFSADDFSEWHPDSESWPKLIKLRSLELRNTDPAYFRAMPYRSLRKVFISTTRRLCINPLVELLTTVAPSIQAFSLIQPTKAQFARATQSFSLIQPTSAQPARDTYTVFSTAFVHALTRCLNLRHFESVGPYFFMFEDWRFLCARAFPFFDQVHVECSHQDPTPPPNYLYSPSTHSIAPEHCKRLHGGRIYVSPSLLSRWAHDVPTPTVKQSKNRYCDRLSYSTQYLCQQFRLQADLEQDLRIARCVVDGQYDEDVDPTPLTFVNATEAGEF